MQDLDLDELDQAVNKMMDKSSRGRRAPRGEVKPVDRPTPVLNSAATSESQRDTQAEPPRATQPEKTSDDAVTQQPARAPESLHVSVNRPMPRVPERRRMHPGAMDIIQPSISPKMTAPSSRPGRLATNLQPTQDVKPEPRIPATISKPEPVAEPDGLQFKDEASLAVTATPEKTTEHTSDASHEVSDEVLASLSLIDEPKPAQNILASEPKAESKPADQLKQQDGWPDPLDFHDFGDKPAESTPSTVAPAASDAASVSSTAPELASQSLSAESELHAEAQPHDMPPTMDTEPVSVTDKHDDAANLGSSPFVTTKVEKRPLGAFADAAHEPPKAALPEADAHVPHESTNKEDLASASLESKQHLEAHDEHDPTDLRSMTIPPQYHQAEQKPHDDIHHMYDTKEYHAAPQHMHTAHKSSPALVVSIVVLVVLIIAALAVGYLMMTGALDLSMMQ